MNNTIDFNTAKTIDTMSKKIDHIDDTVSGFFSFMHMVILPFVDRFPTDLELYRIMTTKLGEVSEGKKE